jgi:glycosyltransferase involved in cell wall biosynthesis
VVVVVDDGSTDATARIAEAAGAVVIRHERNQGKGMALNTGFEKARELSAGCVVLLDADGQHFPEEMPAVLDPVLKGEADLVIGSRYLNGHGIGVPGHRVWGHRVFNLLTRAASGVGATDSQSGFRAMSRRALRELGFSSTGFSVESEMQFLAHELGLRVVEVPITADYAERPKRPVVHHGLLVLNGVLRLVGQYRPLLFFGLPGAIVLVLGLLWGAWVVNIYQQTQTLAVGYALISIMLAILGSLGLFAGIILHSIRGLLLELVGREVGQGQVD